MPEIPCGVSGIVLVFFGPKYPDFPAVFTVRRQRQANLGKSRAAPVVSVVSVASVADGLIARRAVVCSRSQSGRADNKKDRLQKRSFRLNDSGISRFGFVGRKPRPAVRPMAILRGARTRFARNPCHALLRTARTADFRAASRPARNGEPILSRCRSAWDPPSAHAFRGACCRGTA